MDRKKCGLIAGICDYFRCIQVWLRFDGDSKRNNEGGRRLWVEKSIADKNKGKNLGKGPLLYQSG